MAQHDDAIERRITAEAAKFEALDEADIDETMRVLLTLPKGRKFVWWLLQIGKVGTQPFNTDPGITAFNCGELNVGNGILQRVVEVNPQGYIDLMKERQTEDERRNQYYANLRGANGSGIDSSPDDAGDPSGAGSPE